MEKTGLEKDLEWYRAFADYVSKLKYRIYDEAVEYADRVIFGECDLCLCALRNENEQKLGRCYEPCEEVE